MKSKLGFFQQRIVQILRMYQCFFSPDHSYYGKRKYPLGFCRYYPSCSEYSCQSIINHGICKGLFFSLLRVLKCNPWKKGGIDLPK